MNSMSEGETFMSLQNFNLSICPEDVYSDGQRAFRLYVNAPISMFGILTNLLNIVIFADFELRQQLVNHFLLALSLSDLLLLLGNFFFLVLPVLVVETKSFLLNDLFPYVIRYSYPLALTVQTTGVYLTVLVSVHRYLGVCHPFKAKLWVTRKPVECAIIGSLIFSFIINTPTWMELGVSECNSERFQRTSRQIDLASFHSSHIYILVKKCISYNIFMFIIPFTSLIIVNLKMIQALRLSSRMRTQHSYCSTNYLSNNDNISRQLHLLKKTRYSEVFKTISKISYSSILRPSSELFKPRFTNSTRDRSITWMLLAIVALFLLCNGLAFLNSIAESAMNYCFGEDEKLNFVHWFESSVEISNVLITLNSSTSIFVYLIFSSKYRMIFKSMVGLHNREKLNKVALTTAMAARRVMELSLIPEEVESRSRRRTFAAFNTMSTSNSSFDILNRHKMEQLKSYSGCQLRHLNNGKLNNTAYRQSPSQKAFFLKDSQSSVQLHFIDNSSSSAIQRRAMFRGLQKSSKELFRSQGSLNHSLTPSESNLRLMDEQEGAEKISASEQSEMNISHRNDSNNNNLKKDFYF